MVQALLSNHMTGLRTVLRPLTRNSVQDQVQQNTAAQSGPMQLPAETDYSTSLCFSKTDGSQHAELELWAQPAQNNDSFS